MMVAEDRDSRGRVRSRTNFRWDQRACDYLLSGYEAGRSAEEIARYLGCSVNAVRVRATVMGVTHARYAGDLARRFWIYVHPEPNSGCWLWAGSTDRNGYGQFRLPQEEGGKLVYATHVSLRLAGRPNSGDLDACHTCDFPPCVNQDHLFWGTAADNMRDCMAKGRHSKPPICKAGTRPLKTVCVNGHELTEENVFLRPDGYRACRLCRIGFKAKMRSARYQLGLTARGLPRIRNVNPT